MDEDCIVFVVDDDARIREALVELLASYGILAMAFSSGGDYMHADKPDMPACLLLDVELPDISGLDLQGQIAENGHPPIVFITGYGDIPSSVRAIKNGALDFLTKPFSDADIKKRNSVCDFCRIGPIAPSAAKCRCLNSVISISRRAKRDVLPLVVSGLLNKQAAASTGNQRGHSADPPKKRYAENGGHIARRSRADSSRLEIPLTQFKGERRKAIVHRRRPPLPLSTTSPRVTESLGNLLESAGYAVVLFLIGGGTPRMRPVRRGCADYRHRTSGTSMACSCRNIVSAPPPRSSGLSHHRTSRDR